MYSLFTIRSMFVVESCLPSTSRYFASSLPILPAPPAAPGTPSVSFTIPGQKFNISWDEPVLNTDGTVDAYFVNISGPNDLCGSVNTPQRVTTPSYMCSGWRTPAGQKYSFTVQAANCGGSLRGPESDPGTVCLWGML